MALRSTLCVYGWCESCKKFHYQPAHSVIDDSDLPKTCGCGSEIIWDAMSHHNFPKPEVVGKNKGVSSWFKKLSPTDGLETCLLVFTILLMAIVGSYIHFDVNSWIPLWKWTVILSSVILMLVVWLLERKLMQNITDNLTRRVLEEGRLQGQYLEKKGLRREHKQTKQGENEM